MSETLDLSKSVHDLAKEHPGFIDVMVGLGFTDIAKPAALNTVGRMMTIPRGAAIKGIDLEDAINAFRQAGFEVVGLDGDGEMADAASAGAGRASAGSESQAGNPSDSTKPKAGAKVEGLDEAGRGRLLQSYVARLSAGEPLEDVRRDFVANFEDVDAAEIARAEQSLIEGGVAVSDVQRLCDVHSALFHGATREERIANAESAVMDSLAQGSGADDFQTKVLAGIPGHPVHVFAAENDAIAAQIARTRAALDGPDAEAELKRLCQLGIHYAKKGDLLYPILKVRHGFSGPSDVMWGVDDEIRAELRAVAGAADHGPAWHERAKKVLTRADEMTYKEANILLPLCVQNFADDEWLQMYADMKGYDLCLIEDAGTWQTGEEWCAEHRGVQASIGGGADAGVDDGASGTEEVRLPSGRLTPAQLDAMLNTLPLEISFIDDHEINRYWNDDGEKKLFKRPSSALGREVWACHPPKVEQMVRSVIGSLKSGKQDSVDVWMEKAGEPVLVRYMAVRDRAGAYVGTMEVVQRMGFAKEHFAK